MPAFSYQSPPRPNPRELIGQTRTPIRDLVQQVKRMHAADRARQARLARRRSASLWLAAFALAGLLALVLLWPSCARAETAEPQLGTCFDEAKVWCIEPATAVGWQLNMKTGDTARGVVLVGYQLVRHSNLNLGVGAYLGVGVSNDEPSAVQGDLLISVSSFGAVGVGLQAFRARNGDGLIYQTLLTLVLNLPSGGTTDYLREATK